MKLTKSEKIHTDITDIAKAVRKEVKAKHPNCKFSVTVERYSGGQSLTINLMKAPFEAIRTYSEVEKYANKIPSNLDTSNGIMKLRQADKNTQLNHNTLFKEWEKDEPCNGTFITKEAHDALRTAVKKAEEYHYDESDAMTDYFNTNFYIHTGIGTWIKPFEVIVA